MSVIRLHLVVFYLYCICTGLMGSSCLHGDKPACMSLNSAFILCHSVGFGMWEWTRLGVSLSLSLYLFCPVWCRSESVSLGVAVFVHICADWMILPHLYTDIFSFFSSPYSAKLSLLLVSYISSFPSVSYHSSCQMSSMYSYTVLVTPAPHSLITCSSLPQPPLLFLIHWSPPQKTLCVSFHISEQMQWLIMCWSINWWTDEWMDQTVESQTGVEEAEQQLWTGNSSLLCSDLFPVSLNVTSFWFNSFKQR